MEFLPILLVGSLVVYIAYIFLKRISSSGIESPVALRSKAGSIFKWPEIGEYCFEVVGESHYQKALRKHAGEHGEDGCETYCSALLVPEDHNEYDNKAVRVTVGVDTVGYLSRDDARSFRRRLSTKKMSGEITGCNAVIKGGYMRNGEKMSYGIWLDMKEFS
jgi:hypothetical protein